MKRAWMLALLLYLPAVPLVETQEQRECVDKSGKAFLSLCEDAADSTSKQSHSQEGECFGYVHGVDDGIGIAYDIIGQPKSYCFPDGVTHGQMMRVLIKFIKDHPEKAHSQTRVLEMRSFMDAFPCKRPSKK
jgi:Rap1a immunity proteins